MTSRLADHSDLIEALLTHLDVALGTLDQHSAGLSTSIDQLQQLVSGLAADRDPIGSAIVHLDDLADSASSLLAQIRPDLASTLNRVETISGTVNANGAVVNVSLRDLAHAYKTVAGIGVYGDFFNFYVCDVQVKATGPDGNPGYTPWVLGHDARCTTDRNGKP